MVFPPIFRINSKKVHKIKFSVIDDNHDLIKCRWANIFNDECSGNTKLNFKLTKFSK